ncbi:MAG: hypothetical protein LBG31_06685 [Prevotellaceae bacterium]|jgi:uncharacterized protein (TIGR02145 family)|nr:hypothetical protein [Prevotellaceae bacterium]
MKKIFFLFAMLASVIASAQSHINIEMLSATYTTSPAVKFRVSWSSVPTVTGQTHNAKVWVWIDFLKFNADNTTTGNTWTRAEISATPAVSSSPTSTAALDASTNKGFWLNGVTGSYSATVTVTLTNIPANTKFNWCAYVSDCPPGITAANGTYTFNGTPPFILKAANGSTQTVTGKTLPASSLTIAAVTLTDKTECPGVFCAYTGSDLYIDATHLCRLRASGAENWEAWIKDTRDNKLYRIVLMPDTKWWLAQNVQYASAGNVASWCTPDECGRLYTTAEITASYNSGTSGGTGNMQGICPPGWVLPICTDWQLFISSMGATNAVIRARIRPTSLSGATDYYGWADIKQHCGGQNTQYTCWYYQYAYHNHSGLIIDWEYDVQTCYTPFGGLWRSEVRCWRNK